MLRTFTVNSGSLLQNSDAAFDELLVFQAYIDHEVAVDMAKTRHGAGGQHVEHHFLRGACLHARRSGNYLRTDFHDDGNVNGLGEQGISVTGDRDSGCSAALGKLYCRGRVRRAPAGCNSDYYVAFGGPSF